MHNSRTLWQIITKLDPYMYWVTGSCRLPGQLSRSQNQVTRSENRPNFEIAITLLIFELKLWSIAQNVGSALGYPINITYFRWHFWRKSSHWPQNFITLQKFYLFNIAPIRYQKWKDHVQIMREKIFSWWWRHWWRHSVTTKSAFYIHV